MRKLSLVLCLLFSSAALAEDLWYCAVSKGDGTGSSFSNCKSGAVAMGSGAGNFGRGDKLYLCGTDAAPIALTTTLASVGAFDGTVSETADIVEVSGEAAECGGTQGVISGITGNGILASGASGLAFYAHHLTFTSLTSNGISNAYGTTACAVASGFYCTYIHHITCTDVGNNCVVVAATGTSTVVTSQVPGVLIEDVTSTRSGGSGCRIRLNTTGAVERRCTSTGDGYAANTWPVYQAGVVLGCGASGTVDWTRIGGAGTFTYKTSQVNCTATTGATIIAVNVPVHLTGIPSKLVKDTGCVTDDATCEASLVPGEWGQIGDNVYMNRGDALCAAATPCDNSVVAIDLVYAVATGSIIEYAHVTDPSAAFDGIGAGCDYGEDNCTVRFSYVTGAPSYSYSFGRGISNSTIYSSISRNAVVGAVNINNEGSIYNISSSGTAQGVTTRPAAGETVTVSNFGGTGLSDIAVDALIAQIGGAEGTLTETNNSTADPKFLGGTSPVTAKDFKLRAASAYLCTGLYRAGAFGDYGNRAFVCPTIGAWGNASRDEAGARATP